MSISIHIVEDEQPIITLVKYNLEKEGYKVSFSDNGNEGIEEIKRILPDLVLLDWMLPDFSGIEVCRQIKRDNKLMELLLFVITASSVKTKASNETGVCSI